MKIIIGFVFCIGIGFMIMTMPSCGYDYFVPVDVVIPDTVSFSTDIIPIFDESCSLSGCHVAGGVAPNLSATNAWFELWIFGYVDTSNASSSILYQEMNSDSDPMPPNGKLTDDKVQLVLAWIEQGSLDN